MDLRTAWQKHSQDTNKRRAATAEEYVFLDLLRICDLLSRGLAEVLKTEDLSATQYNVLRILRGTPEGLLCGDIASRMITRDPDVTRLLDRLEKRGLILRSRETRDRRMVMARMTPEGSGLARLTKPVQAVHHKQLGIQNRPASALTNSWVPPGENTVKFLHNIRCNDNRHNASKYGEKGQRP
jgi:DNA-binding MarR family transcriptional regulator